MLHAEQNHLAMDGSGRLNSQNTNIRPVELFSGQPRYQRVKRALSLIGFGRSKLYALIRDGRIRAVKLDGATFIDLASVAALFEQCPQIVPAEHVEARTLTFEQLGFDAPPHIAAPRDLDEPPALSVNATELAELAKPQSASQFLSSRKTP